MTWPIADTLQGAVEQAEARYMKRVAELREAYFQGSISVQAHAHALTAALRRSRSSARKPRPCLSMT